MFERYTQAARVAIFAARYHAGESDSVSIETEHLLLGLADADGALLRRVLGSEELVEALCKELRPTSVRPHVTAGGDLPLTDESKRVLAYGAEEGSRLGHQHLDTEHLLVGLMREENCRAAQVLRERGLTLEQARKDLEQL